MRVINSIRFLITFIWLGVLTFGICIIMGTDAVFEILQKNGVILTNDQNKRDGKK